MFALKAVDVNQIGGLNFHEAREKALEACYSASSLYPPASSFQQ